MSGMNTNQPVALKNALEIKNLNFYYGSFQGLKNINLDIAEKHGIIKKVSTRYELSNGVKVFGKNINEEPEKYFTQDILDQIDEACKKEFLYGQDSVGVVEEEELANVDE